eukprot:TRINITY_DN14389_c0_g1_i1.p1 TRINITY_DN14389_c0_g1~~TRINITY_DN14389_c0_g1_i1.p1  ORF type:complete len:591 (+),score=197.05 TRINITY_DN14389_c0_g1_i1:45-1775(+)
MASKRSWPVAFDEDVRMPDEGKQAKRDNDEVEFENEPEIEEESVDYDAIAKLVDEAPQVEAVDSLAVKKLVLGLEKKINQNQMLRVKFPDKPEKFVESEVDLDDEIKKLSVVATAPELYPELVELGGVQQLVTLLSHDNTDIVAEAVGVLHELTDADTLTEADEALSLVEAFLKNQGIEALVAAIRRLGLDDSQGGASTGSAEEARAVHEALGILENLLEVRPDLYDEANGTVSEQAREQLLRFLLSRISASGGSGRGSIDDIKLYAAESLAMLLQGAVANQRQFGALNGFEPVLTAIAPYRKRVEAPLDDEEFVGNLLDALAAALGSQSDLQRDFARLDGLQLMLRLVKVKGFARAGALRVIDYALARHSDNCRKFVEMLGLKTLFAAFMKVQRSASSKHRKGFDERADNEHIAAIIVSLFRHVRGQLLQRLQGKFRENDGEKLERLVELHDTYWRRLQQLEKQIADDTLQLKLELEEAPTEDELTARRLDGGLYTLQLIDTIIAYVVYHAEPADRFRDRFEKLLSVHGQSLRDVHATVLGYVKSIGNTIDEDEAERDRTHLKHLADALLQDSRS